MLGGSREMIDLVFEASIAEVMDEYFGDQRLHDAFFGGRGDRHLGGPPRRGTASVKLMHHQGDLDGTGSNWAYVEGGMGMVSFAIADAARDAGATLACGVPVARVDPGAGVELEDGTGIRARVVISNADPKVAMDLLGTETIDSFDSAYRERLEAWDVRSPVVKFNAALDELPNWAAADGETWPARAMIELTDGIDSAQAAFERCVAGSPPSGSPRSTPRPASTRARLRRASTR